MLAEVTSTSAFCRYSPVAALSTRPRSPGPRARAPAAGRFGAQGDDLAVIAHDMQRGSGDHAAQAARASIAPLTAGVFTLQIAGGGDDLHLCLPGQFGDGLDRRQRGNVESCASGQKRARM
jgi:hypothetical protein